MSPKPNVDFLSADVDVEAVWTFTAPAHAATVSTEPDEILPLVDAALVCCDPFVRFYECELVVNVFESDIPCEERLDSEAEKLATRKRTLTADRDDTSDDPGIQTGDIRAAVTEMGAGGYALLSAVTFMQSEVFVTLRNFEGYVDRSDEGHYRTVKVTDVREGPAYDDPFNLKIAVRTPVTDNFEGPVAYDVKLTSITDLWFEPTEIGATNRERLCSTLRCLDENIPDGHRYYWGEPYGELAPYEVEFLQPIAPWIADGRHLITTPVFEDSDH